jgi:hypothetical protein
MWHLDLPHKYSRINVNTLTTQLFLNKNTYTSFWWGNLRERGHLGDPGINGRIILR